MLSDDFYGKKPFVWWVGVVEDRTTDPLKMGLLRVRIIGLHPQEKELVPTEALPWVQSLHPVTGNKTSSGAREGDWVWGFFQDGEAAQIPVIIGVFSGVDQVVNIAGKPYTDPGNLGFRDVRTKAQVDAAPRPPEHVVFRKAHTPATHAPLARGELDGTGIKNTNANLSHACDISGYVKTVTGKTKFIAGKIAMAIREAIQALIKLVGGTDTSGIMSTISGFLKQVASKIRMIRDFVTEITDFVRSITEVVAIVAGIIKFVLSLPARLAKFLKECMSSVMSAIGDGLSDLVSSAKSSFSISGGSSDFTSLMKDVKAVGTEAKATFGAVTGAISTGVSLGISDAKQFGSDTLNKMSSFTSLEDITSATASLTGAISQQKKENISTASSSMFSLDGYNKSNTSTTIV